MERRLNKGIVVVKVVKVGSQGEELLVNTTRFTNSQNAVSQKDFIALESSFKIGLVRWVIHIVFIWKYKEAAGIDKD